MRKFIVILAAGLVSAAQAAPVQVGKLAFVAETNVKMFRFSGKAEAVQSKLEREGSKLTALEIRVPVAQLTTGMDIRDKHMHERIFVASDGTSPDIVFTASSGTCQPQASAGEELCTVSGKLSFRGTTRDFPLTLILKDGRKAIGKAVIDVLEFGVKPEALAWTSIKVNPRTQVDFEVELP
jgi:polyisoprenoid-binding protein YceI